VLERDDLPALAGGQRAMGRKAAAIAALAVLDEAAGKTFERELAQLALLDGELHLRPGLGDRRQRHASRIGGVRRDAEAIVTAEDALLAQALEHAAGDLGRQRPLAWPR